MDRLDPKPTPSLTTEEENTIRWFWIQLNSSPEEAEESSILNKRREVLYQNRLTGKSTPEETAEWTKVSGRITELAHDIGMRRVSANSALRDRVWGDLAPRVLRYYKLTEKPNEELTDDETEELVAILKWFKELQREALQK